MSRRPDGHLHRACRRRPLTPAIRMRRTIFAVAVAVVLIGELVSAWAFVLTAAGNASQPWPPSIAVVGDSYTAGSQNRVVWPTLLAQRTAWSVSNFALPGAGFVADGFGGYAFTYQVDRAQAANVRIIVVVGGVADSGLADLGPVSVGAVDAINKIKVGGQRALVIGPTWYETPVPASVRRVSDAIRKVAEAAGVPYLDALDPPWLTRDQMQRDLSGPTDQGQSVIADKIAAWLRSEVAG
jgi:GDSL-like Lipase/Acylhydrolase family